MHICDLDLGMLGANGIVAAGPPIAVGRRVLRPTYRGTDNVAVRLLRRRRRATRAPSTRPLNMAGLMNLPAVFVCENNLYGEFTGRLDTRRSRTSRSAAAGYGIPGVIVDGQDVLAVRRVAGEAIERARDGGGPTLHRGQDLPLLRPRRPGGMGPVYRDPRRGRRVAASATRSRRLEAVLLERDLVSSGELAAINDEIVGRGRRRRALRRGEPAPRRRRPCSTTSTPCPSTCP